MLTPEQKVEAVRLRLAGYGYKRIAEALNCREAQVQKHCQRQHLPRFYSKDRTETERVKRETNVATSLLERAKLDLQKEIRAVQAERRSVPKFKASPHELDEFLHKH
jgi:hypothetical protein